ncbi:MFS transporter [Rosenbergiella australiborealis]|uniref:MFS transporter n=1 Tax=Rosenbergiella australiborealis TaxID=1544696 RepID=UPI001F4E123E|nr:MFS transporter [Rosenbergiella australiborealis]
MSALSRPVVLLLSGLLLLTVCIAVLNTQIPLWLSHASWSTLQIGLISSAFFTGNLTGTLFAGKLINRLGFNRSYYLATALFAIATLMLVFSHAFETWAFWRFIAGNGCALLWVIVESALLCAGTLSSRGGLLAAYMIVYYMGTVLGQLFISALPLSMATLIPALVTLMMLAIIPLLFVVVSAGQAEEALETPKQPGVMKMFFQRQSRLGINGCIISGVVLGSLYGLMPLYLSHKGMSDSHVGDWMALLISAGIIAQWPLGKLADRYGRLLVLRVQVFVVILAALSMLMNASLVAGLFILGSAGFTLYPIAMAWACEKVAHSELIPMNQALLLSYTAGSLVGPAITSLLMETWSDNILFVMIATVSFVYLMMLLRKTDQQANPIAHA